MTERTRQIVETHKREVREQRESILRHIKDAKKRKEKRVVCPMCGRFEPYNYEIYYTSLRLNDMGFYTEIRENGLFVEWEGRRPKWRKVKYKNL